MEQFINIFLHIDVYLASIFQAVGLWTYVILFVVVFCETGLVITPFLPGDSLIFAVGSLAARGMLNIHLALPILVVAALCGDNVNYFFGRTLGPRIFNDQHQRFFKRKHLDKTHAFYEKYGGKTIIIARFIPIVRTFTPFVAGIGRMNYFHFLAYSIIGALLWVGGIGTLSYLFGNLPYVQANFSWVIMGIVAISVMPMIIEILRLTLLRSRSS